MWREMVVIDEHLQMMEEGGSSRGWLAPQHPSKWCQPGSSDAGVPQLSWCSEENSSEGEKADICLTGKQKTRKAGLFYWCPPLEATTRSTTEFSQSNGSAENAVKEKGFNRGKRRGATGAGNNGFSKEDEVWGLWGMFGSAQVSYWRIQVTPFTWDMCPVCPRADTLCLSQGLTGLESSKENWLWGQYWGKTAAEKSRQFSAHLQFSTQCREGC